MASPFPPTAIKKIFFCGFPKEVFTTKEIKIIKIFAYKAGNTSGRAAKKEGEKS